MRFDLIQSLSLAGDDGVANDDRAGSIGNRAWVIDGATDLGPPGLVGARGGAAWIAEEAQAAFLTAGDSPIETIHAAVAERLIAAFSSARTREPLGRWELPIAASLAVRLDSGQIACGSLGDCVGLLCRGSAVSRIGAASEVREKEVGQATALAAHRQGGVKQLAAPAIEALRLSRGRSGIRVLGVVPEVMAKVDITHLPVAPGDELILMTDGYAALIDAYGAYDDASLAHAVRDRGLAALAEELRLVERDDGECSRFPRFKASDDATALWLRVGA